MNSFKTKARLLLVTAFLYGCKTPKYLTNKVPNDMEVYLLIGQSNMAGRAIIEPQDSDSLEHVFLFTGEKGNIWNKAVNPLNTYSTVRKKLSMQKLGPGYAFAKAMIKANPNKNIGLVVNAKGGTSIEEWAPNGTLYQQAVIRTSKALKNGVLKGVLWHQGESNTAHYNTYMPKLITLIKAIRNDFNLPNLPFVVGQLSPDKPERINFNKMLLELPKSIIHTAVVKTDSTSTIDKTHFDSASQRLLGRRYAEEMLKLLD
ncbi:protein of unknown function (DUF303) [Jejuia pallidilutea]|uniref:Sialate O-acetylesterase domain-containing protein n=1 Tax=Jejuia pallidilutea TaxID=504487 RepID=A0A362XAE0_9FLAO|nr:sialate O-acetylesterase [Jejuia pallidilutea]PQV51171.1 protein of unknown function (DUF303) [Jejuia pallidilutea]